jgi:hypothetical protein
MFILWPIELILVHIPQKPENNVDAAIVEWISHRCWLDPFGWGVLMFSLLLFCLFILLIGEMGCWNRYKIGFVCFSFNFYQFLLHIFCNWYFVHTHLGLLYLLRGLILSLLHSVICFCSKVFFIWH